MSYAIQTANKIHDHQVAAASTLQSLLVEAFETLSGLTALAPKAPESLSSSMDEVVGPLTKIVGTPREVQAFVVASSRDWLDVQHKFRTELLDAASGSTVTVDVPQKAAAKKN